MNGQAAMCPRCGRRFFANSLVGGPGHIGRLEIGDGVHVSCPRDGCGGTALVAPGAYSGPADAMVFVDGPEWTKELVESLRRTLHEIVESRPQNPLVAVAKTSPEVASQVQQVTQGWSTDRILALIGVMYGLLGTDYGKLAGNVKTAGAVLQELFKYVAETGRVPGS